MSYIEQYLHYFGPSTNRAYMDTVFRDLFGEDTRKENTLSLYNALNGSDYSNPDKLEITTLSGAIYMGFRNDVSFIVGSEMMLWEHQSTFNPNMPLRGLFYLAELYSKLLAVRGLNRFSTKLVRLPTPRFFVFYTGRRAVSEREVMRLSDAFTAGKGDLEVTVTMLDVHEGRNKGIMEACETLAGYAHLVGLVQRGSGDMLTAEAVDAAIQQCIDDGYLVDYLTERRSEVVGMMLSEWNAEETLRMLRQEAVEDGLAEGRAEGRAESRDEFLAQVATMIHDGIISSEVASERFGFTHDELEQALAVSQQ